MAAAAKGLRQMGAGCCVETETMLTDDRYPKTVLGYRVILSKVASPQQGGVTLLWEEGHQDFEVEAVTISSPNLLTFQLVTGEERYFVMGVYITPADTTGVDDLRVAWTARPINCKSLLLGDLNINSRTPQTEWEEIIADFHDKINDVDTSRKYIQRKGGQQRPGHGGLVSSGGEDGGTTPNQIIFWPVRRTQRHSGMWHVNDRGSMTRIIVPSSPQIGGDGRGGSRNICGAAGSSPCSLHRWGNRIESRDSLGDSGRNAKRRIRRNGRGTTGSWQRRGG